MKTLELRKLIKDKTQLIPIPASIEEVFNVWLKKRQEKEPNIAKINMLEIFYAGYILSNPIVREQYKQLSEHEQIIKMKFN